MVKTQHLWLRIATDYARVFHQILVQAVTKVTRVFPLPSVDIDAVFLFVLVIPEVLELPLAISAGRLQAVALGTIGAEVQKALDEAATATLLLRQHLYHP